MGTAMRDLRIDELESVSGSGFGGAGAGIAGAAAGAAGLSGGAKNAGGGGCTTQAIPVVSIVAGAALNQKYPHVVCE